MVAEDQTLEFLDTSNTTSDSSVGATEGIPAGLQTGPVDPNVTIGSAHVAHAVTGTGIFGIPIRSAPTAHVHVPPIGIGVPKSFSPVSSTKRQPDCSLERNRAVPRSPCPSVETTAAQQQSTWQRPTPPTIGGKPSGAPPMLQGKNTHVNPGRSSSPGLRTGERPSKASPTKLEAHRGP